MVKITHYSQHSSWGILHHSDSLHGQPHVAHFNNLIQTLSGHSQKKKKNLSQAGRATGGSPWPLLPLIYSIWGPGPGKPPSYSLASLGNAASSRTSNSWASLSTTSFSFVASIYFKTTSRNLFTIATAPWDPLKAGDRASCHPHSPDLLMISQKLYVGVENHGGQDRTL